MKGFGTLQNRVAHEMKVVAAPRNNSRRKEFFWAAVFLLPTLVTLIALRLAPIVSAVFSSFYTSFPGGLQPAIYTGWENFNFVFSDPDFLNTIRRTILFNLIINPVQIALSLLVSIIMVQRIKFEGVWRTLVFIPITIPIVGSTITWHAIFKPDGPLNAFLSTVGISDQPFINSPEQALTSISVVASWIGIGYWMMFLISGLRAIPSEIYDAAEIDRAGPIRVFFSITLPLLRRTLLFVLVATTVANFVLFAPIQLLTAGGPESTTTLLIYDTYRETYVYGGRNLGATKGLILALIMILFACIQFYLMQEKKDKVK
jgi:multiple sugar transport system permease protein